MRFLIALVLLIGCSTEPCGAVTHSSTGQTVDGTMCTERTSRTLALSERFSPEQQAAIISAGDEWNQKTEGRVNLAWVITDQIRADIFPGTPPAGHYAQEWHGKVSLDPSLDPSFLHTLALHEIGHTFGLGHVSDNSQAMHVDATSALTPEDIAHFDRLWAQRL